MSQDDTQNQRPPGPPAGDDDPTEREEGLLDTLPSGNAITLGDTPVAGTEDTLISQTGGPGGSGGPRGGAGGDDDTPVTAEHPGRYEYGAREEIGRGGLGRVLSAFDEHLGREVAVKELLPERRPSSVHRARSESETAEALIRFLREARVTAQLEHPNIVPVYELGRRENGTLYYTMKYVRGRTLKSALKSAHDLPDRLKLLGHFVDLCNAIAYAHSRGVVHRDIKPDNVMIGEFGETVVLDWGVAKVRGKEDLRGRDLARELRLMQEEEGSARTLPGAAFGTPAFMSPEQAEGRIDDVDERSDVWSLGVVLYQILTGQMPFSGSNIAMLLVNVTRGEYRPVNEVCPEAPPELAAVVDDALRLRPPQRYQSAQELAEEIEAYRSGAQVEVYRYSSVELLKRFIERNRSAVMVSIIALVAVLSVMAGAYIRLLGERDRALAAELASRKNLADAFVEKARVYEREKDWTALELEAAGALRQAEHPEARALLVAASGRWRPELSWQERTYAGCAALAHDPTDDAVACATLREVRLWRGSTGELLARIEKAGGWVHALAYSPDGTKLAGAGDGEIVVWDTETREVLARHLGHVDAVYAVSWSSDGRTLASAGHDGTVRLWGDGTIVWRGEGPVKRLAFSPIEDLLVFADAQGNLHRRTVESLRTVEAERAHGKEISALAFARDGRFATAGADRTVRAWSRDSTAKVATPLSAEAAAMAFGPDGALYVAGTDGYVRKLAAGELRGRFLAHGARMETISLSPDGTRLFTAAGDRMVRGLRMARDETPPLSMSVDGTVSALRFAKEAAALAVIVDERMQVLETESGAVVQTAELPVEEASALALSGDWSMIATSSGNTVYSIEPEKGVRRALRGHDGRVTALAFAGDAILSGGADKDLIIWKQGEEEASARLTGAGEKILAVAGTPDLKNIAAADARGRIVVWYGKAPVLSHRLQVAGRVRSLAFSDDGAWLAAAADRRVHLWYTQDWREHMRLTAGASPVEVVAITAEADRIATATEDGSVRIWQLEALGADKVTLLESLEKKRGARLDGMVVTPRF